MFMVNGTVPVGNEAMITPVRTFGLSSTPSVTSAAIVTNPTTTDNMYGGTYTTYVITGNITDDSTSLNFQNVTLNFNSSTTVLAAMRWTNATNAFAEVAGTQAVSTFVGTGTNITDANDFNFTVSISFDWTFTDVDDIYLWIQGYSNNTEFTSQSAGTYDIDTDLSLTSSDFIVRSQVEQNTIFDVNTLTYSYEDSGGAVHPLAAQTDFYVCRDARTTSPTYDAQYWEADTYSESTGVATWTTPITAKGSIHTETFTLFAITQSGTAGTSASCMGTDGTDSVNILDGPPPADDGGGIGDALANPDVITVLAIGGGGIALVFVGYYYMSSNAASTGARGGRKRTQRKTTRKKSMKKSKRRK
jgi:hypothetical protein